MMDCKGCLDRAIYSVRGGQGLVWPGLHIDKEKADLQKGGYAGSRRRTVVGLDHRLGPYQGSMDGKVCPIVQQGFDLLWVQVTTSAECKKVSRYSLF
jgi:hypothetical protein